VVKHHILLAVLWISFCSLHSVLASFFVKKKLYRRFRHQFKSYRLYYSAFAFASFAAVMLYLINLPSPLLYQRTAIIFIGGSFILITGLIIMAICIRRYFGQLSGLRTLFTNELKTGNHLIITGIHRYVRHPLYLGTFLFIWGLFLDLPYASLLISNIIITAYTLIAIRFEENKLVEEFGEQYRLYQKTVPKIIPGLVK
jgi:protein-S-isoprenylcysteine O-methyltransferase Ste14